MTSTELDRLVDPRGLKREPPSRTAYAGLVHSRGQVLSLSVLVLGWLVA